MITRLASILWCLILLALAAALFTEAGTIRRADDRGYQLYAQGAYRAAAETFVDSYWQAIALYRAAEFEDAAMRFAGYNTAEAHFNRANARLLRGQYDAAIECYTHALKLRPNWQPARTNHAIALARAALLKTEGGASTDGKLGADDYVIHHQPKRSATDGDPTEPVDGMPLSDAEIRAVWLRQVQTNPADFLKSKFHYQAQQHMREAAP